MIFFLPVFSRKISSAINRRTVRKNGLKILDLSVQVWDANRTKFCSQKKTLKIFYLSSSWQSLLTAIWFSRLTLRVSHWFFIRVLLLNSRSENFEPRIKKQQDFFESAFFREKRTTNIGKSWSNKYYAKISGQNQFEKVNFEKIFTKTFKPFIETFEKRLWRYEER